MYQVLVEGMGLRLSLLFSFSILEVWCLWVSIHHYFCVCGCAMMTLDVVTQAPAVLSGNVRTQWSQRIVLKGGETKGK